MSAPTLNIDNEWAAGPLSRAEAYMLFSKIQRLIILHSQFRMAMDKKAADAAQQFSDDITAVSREIEVALAALVKMPALPQ